MRTNRKESVLFLHAGGTKAGSSALQSFLELNSAKLDSLGISYRNKAGVSFEHQISSGNGALLLEALVASRTNAGYLGEVVRSYFHENNIAICSNEQFGELSSEQWSRLADACKQADIKLRVIFYVRNVIPFIKSSYDQLIKRHGLYEDFEKWGAVAVWSHSKALKTISTVIAPDEITVVSYDEINKRVVGSFVELIGAENLKATSDPIVNRSLTRLERDLLRKVNRHTSSGFSTELSDRMIYAAPHAQSESIEVDEHIEALLSARYKDDIDWINQTFFGGNPTVALGVQRRTVDKNLQRAQGDAESSSADPSCAQQTHDLVLAWALEKLSHARDSGIELVARALAQIDWHLANDPAIPSGFDPIAYLLNNADLIAACASPFEHFLSYGRYEVGRTWTWGEGVAFAEVRDKFRKNQRPLGERDEYLERERIKLDAEYAQLKLDSRAEVEALLRQQVSREQEYFEQLARAQAAMDRERAALTDATEKKLAAMANKHEKQTQALELELVALRRELDQSRQEVEALLRQQIVREKLLAEQLIRVREDFDRERIELVGANDQKLVAAAEHHARYEQEKENEFSALRIQMTRQRDDVETLLRQMVELERQASHELVKELEAMRATSSWRLTAPLRSIAYALKRNYKTENVMREWVTDRVVPEVEK
jgi:hypothetical protein